MTAVVDIFALLTAVAGWYYMFYSRAARRLDRIEASGPNALRVRLRQLGGLSMLLLGVLFFAGFQSWVEERPNAFVAIWMGVLFVLLAIVVLALIDMRLTWKLRHERRREHH